MQAPAKVNTKVNILQKKHEGDEHDAPDETDKDFWAALEEACAELGYDLEKMEKMLESPDFPPQEVLDLVMKKTGATNAGEIKSMLGRQRAAVLSRVKASIKEAKRKKSAEEEAILERVRRIGRCPMGFEWIKCEGGYRCGGGSHFVADSEINFVDDDDDLYS